MRSQISRIKTIWTKLIDHFQLAITAKDIVYFVNLEKSEIPQTQKPILEQVSGEEIEEKKLAWKKETKTQWKSQEQLTKNMSP